jgi:tripartite-type tricarboxylate transporter receptor subunit TctC
MEMLKSAAGLKTTHVPYKGAAASIAALISGEIGLMFETPGAIVPHIRSGRVRALAVSSAQRSVALPDLPTVAEAGGLKGFGAQGWSALAAPAATPAAIIQKLHVELRIALARPDMKKRLLDIGVDPLDFTFEQTGAYFRSEVENWAKAVKSAGIKPE